MKYKGIELTEITGPQIFDPPKEMLVWDEVYDKPAVQNVWVIAPPSANEAYPVISTGGSYQHCTEIPEEPKPRTATNRELAKWLAQGNGEWCNCIGDSSRAAIEWWYDQGHSETKANNVFVRKWDDTDWHEPTVDYMGIE